MFIIASENVNISKDNAPFNIEIVYIGEGHTASFVAVEIAKSKIVGVNIKKSLYSWFDN